MAFPTHIVAAAGYVFDKDGRMLLIRTPHRGWDCTGGQVENGESIEEAVLREIMEESGVRAEIRCLCGIYSNVGQYTFYDGVTPVPTKVMLDFICDYVDGEPRTSDESLEVRWIPREQALDLVTTPVLRYRFDKILHFDGHITCASYVTRPEFQLLSERSL